MVPRLPSWDEVAIVEATANWNEAYAFEILPGEEDYGHKFPAKLLKSFVRNNEHVAGEIRKSLRNPARFWGMQYLGEQINQLVTGEVDLAASISHQERFRGVIGKTFANFFNEKEFSDLLYDNLNSAFTSAEWESALVEGLQALFPFYEIKHVGGRSEQKHGTDILIEMPGLIPDSTYAIAIQVKDYDGIVNAGPVIEQIRKADAHWEEQNPNLKLVDRVIIVIQAKKEQNLALTDLAGDEVSVIYAQDLKDVLAQIGKASLGLKYSMEDLS